MCEAPPRCTMRSAWARMRRASSTEATLALTEPLHGALEADRQRHHRSPARRCPKAADVGFEMHDLVRPERQRAKAERETRIDQIAHGFDDGAHRDRVAGAEVEDAIERRRHDGVGDGGGDVLHVELVPLLRFKVQIWTLA